jgi:hypothetical protein
MNVGARGFPLAGLPITAVLLLSCGGNTAPSSAAPSESVARARGLVHRPVVQPLAGHECAGHVAVVTADLGAVIHRPVAVLRTAAAVQHLAATTTARATAQPEPAARDDVLRPPGLGTGLLRKASWEEQLEGECRSQGHRSDCVTLRFDVYLLAEDGSRTRLTGVGPDYAKENPLRYSSCLTANIPPKGEVELGSVIVVDINCTAVESSDTTSGSSSSATESSDSDGGG